MIKKEGRIEGRNLSDIKNENELAKSVVKEISKIKDMSILFEEKDIGGFSSVPEKEEKSYNENIKNLVQSIIGYYEKLLSTRDSFIECLEGKNSILEKQLDFYKKSISDYEVSAREFIILNSLPDTSKKINSQGSLKDMLSSLWTFKKASATEVEDILLSNVSGIIYNRDTLEKIRQKKLSNDKSVLNGKVKGSFKKE